MCIRDRCPNGISQQDRPGQANGELLDSLLGLQWRHVDTIGRPLLSGASLGVEIAPTASFPSIQQGSDVSTLGWPEAEMRWLSRVQLLCFAEKSQRPSGPASLLAMPKVWNIRGRLPYEVLVLLEIGDKRTVCFSAHARRQTQAYRFLRRHSADCTMLPGTTPMFT